LRQKDSRNKPEDWTEYYEHNVPIQHFGRKGGEKVGRTIEELEELDQEEDMQIKGIIPQGKP